MRANIRSKDGAMLSIDGILRVGGAGSSLERDEAKDCMTLL